MLNNLFHPITDIYYGYKQFFTLKSNWITSLFVKLMIYIHTMCIKYLHIREKYYKKLNC